MAILNTEILENEYSILGYTGVGDGTADDSIPWTNTLAAIPSNGGVHYLPPGSYKLTSTRTVLDREGIIFKGHSYRRGNSTDKIDVTSLKTATDFGSTTAVVQITYGTGLSLNVKGGFVFDGVSMQAGLTAFSGGYGYHLKKETETPTGNNFWGNVVWKNLTIRNGSIGVFVDDSNGSQVGYGWLLLESMSINVCTYGFKSNCTTNNLTFRDCKIWQNTQSSNSSYKTRTGGGIIALYPTGMNVIGCDLEGCQVGVQTSGTGIRIEGNYAESIYDAFVVLDGARGVAIVNNITTNDERTRHIYAYSSQQIRQDNNREAFFILAPHCRDVITDTPELTRFDVNTGGTQIGAGAFKDYGFMIQSLDLLAKQQPVSGTPQISSATPTSATHAEYVGMGPFGQTTKCAEITSSATNGGDYINFTTVPVVAGQFVVVSALVYAPTTNTGTAQLNLRVDENINGAGSAIVFDGTVPQASFTTGEWVCVQWVHKVIAGETSYTSVQMRLNTTVNGNKLVIGGMAMNVVSQPFIRPTVWALHSSGGTDKFLWDGKSYYGTAAPTAATLTWADGEVIHKTDAAVGSPDRWVTTTAGTGAAGTFTATANL